MNYTTIVMLIFVSITALGNNLLEDINFSQINTKGTKWKNYAGKKGLIRKKITIDGKSALLLDNTISGDVGGVLQVVKGIKPNSFYRAEVKIKKLVGKSSKGAFLQLRFVLTDKKIKIFQIPLIPQSNSDFSVTGVSGKAPNKTIKAYFYIYIQKTVKKTALIVTEAKLTEIDSKVFATSKKKVKVKYSYKHLPKCPSIIPGNWLASVEHPKVFCTKKELNSARHKVAATDYGRRYLQKQKRLCHEIIRMNDAQLRALVPKPNSLIVYGLGMNIGPEGSRFRWGGGKTTFYGLWQRQYCLSK